MDLPDLLKSAPQLQSIATTIVAGVPLAEIVKRIVLPSADALGERMKNRVERCFAKTAKMIEDTGVPPQSVEDKLVVEILRGASLEENADLHTMWAALLANAASSERNETVRPSFVAILQQMHPHEAFVLNRIFDDANVEVTAENEFRRSGLDIGTLSKSVNQSDGIKPEPFEGASKDHLSAVFQSLSNVSISLDALIGQQLVEKTYWREEGGGVFTEVEVPLPDEVDYTFTLTHRGRSFLEACRPPKPKQ